MTPAASDADLPSAFEKLLGRQASPEERANLYRVRDALGLHANDALWLVLLALESYDVRFRAYPEQLAAAAAKAAHDLPEAVSRAVRQEVIRVRGDATGSDGHAGTWRLFAVLLAVTGALVAFGALCMLVGAGAAQPSVANALWQRPDPTAPVSYRLACAVLSMPAGWMLFVLLLPVAVVGAWRGWKAATDTFADRRRRLAGGALIALCATITAATCVVLGRVL